MRGRENDGSSLYYNRARYYRPEWGRFISEDPIGVLGGLNQYRYAGNNPLAAKDPSGKWLETALDLIGLALDLADFLEEPTFGKAVLVMADTIGVLAPGLPSVGAIRHADNILDAVKACFPAGTLILTEGGEKPIEQIRAGDLVLSADPVTGKQSYQRVAQAVVREAGTLLTIVTQDGRGIEATPDHPFWVVNKGFVEAKRLARGDLLMDASGRHRAITSITEKRGRVTVYNFEVEGSHTYYAGGLWVHNARCPTGPVFRNQATLQDHFTRHGADFGATTAAQYEAQASHFFWDADPRTLFRRRTNGDLVMYNPITDEFGVLSGDGYIRTYYRPNPAQHGYATNEDYFRHGY